jgi:hypothetical protein
MANMITDSRTWDGQEADEIFAKPLFTDPQLLDSFRVVQNVTSKKKLSFDNNIQKVLKAKAGCARDVNNKIITLSERTLEVETVGFDMEQCATELSDQIEETYLNKGNDIHDLNGTFIKTYIEEKVAGALQQDIPRLIFFGDKASVDPAYSPLDGVFKVLDTYAATNPDMAGAQIPLAAADGSTGAGADAVLGVFRDLYKKQAAAMVAVPKANKRFIVSNELKEALVDAYTTKAGAVSGDIFISRTEGGEGEEVVRYKGIEVVGMANWTEIIENDFNASRLYRAILTVKENLVLGTDRIADMMSVKFEYHPYQRVNTLETRFKLGFQLLWPEFTLYATSAPAV